MCSGLACYSCSQKQSSSQASMLSDAEKIVGLSKCWSEAKYNFVYFDRLTFDWDSLYQATIPVVLATKNDFEYYRELQRFVARLQDGHTGVWWNWDRLDLREYWATIPIFTRLIDGKMIIIEVRNDTLEEKGIKRGLEIIKINGIDVHEYVSTNIKPFVFSSTEQWTNLIAYGIDATRGRRSESVHLTFRDENNQIFERKISRSMSVNVPSPRRPVFDFTVLENNIGLLKIDDFWRNNFIAHFDSIYKKILATDALIIDIRGNDGGSSNNSIYVLSHLTNESFEMARWSSQKYIPAFASWGHQTEWYVNEPWIAQPITGRPFYSKPVVLIIDESTFSAAEDFCVGFRNMNRGPIIGSPSGGSTGNPIGFAFPFGGVVQLCTKKDTYPDGTEFVGIGILPDIEVRETVSSFFAKTESGKDNTKAVQKAIEVLKSSMK